jgi:hypothetical protein
VGASAEQKSSGARFHAVGPLQARVLLMAAPLEISCFELEVAAVLGKAVDVTYSALLILPGDSHDREIVVARIIDLPRPSDPVIPDQVSTCRTRFATLC